MLGVQVKLDPLYQMTFAIITSALIVEVFVERIGFGFVLLFSSLWMLVVYAPVAHWTWGAQLGRLAMVGLWTVAVTWGLVKLVALVTPLRVDAETEYNGLDLSAHGERVYERTS